MHSSLKPHWSPKAILALGMLTFAVLTIGSACRESATFDEPLHIASGYVSWKQATYTLDPNPPLILYWMSLPLLARDLRLPPMGSEIYLHSPRTFSFLFVYHNEARPEILLNVPRLMIVLLGMALGVLLFQWAGEAMGPVAAMATFVAYIFCPMILAHSHLATVDIGNALFCTLTLYCLWRWRKRPSCRSMGMAGIAYGLALCAKYSSIVIAPIAVIALGLGWTMEKKDSRWTTKDFLLGSVFFCVGALGVMEACYRGIGLPAWWMGFRQVLKLINAGHPNFFLSQYSDNGWRSYFLIGFLLKTPIPFLVFILLGFTVRGPRGVDRFALLWGFLPSFLFLLAVSFSPTQVGIRHILIVYPLLCLCVGSAAAALWALPWRGARAIVLVLGAWYAGATLFLYPRYISYFNEVVGGPSRGHRYLLDSNLDWGQGLKALGSYLEKEGVHHVYLSYFGCADPQAYGIRYTPVAGVTCTNLPGDGGAPESTEKKVLFAISATNRGGVYYTPHTAFSWLNQRQPVKVLLDSIWVYDITNDAEALGRLRMLTGQRRGV